MPNTYIKNANNWSKLKKAYIKNGGNWSEIKNIWVKNAGVWQKVFMNMPSTIQVLIAGGGGGGGGKAGGGGGGLIEWVSITPVQGTSYPIVIGAGGSGGVKGGDTTAFGKMAMGGGFGAAYLAAGNPGGSGGGGDEVYRGGNQPGGASFEPGVTINGVTFNTATHVAKQGYNGGYGFSNNSVYTGGQGGGYTALGRNGWDAFPAINDNGYVTDTYLRQVPPFNNTGGEVVTRISTGGGYTTAFSGSSDTPIGTGKWYANGGFGGGGAGTQGIVVVRYAGGIVGVGGNYVTYNPNNDTTYHVFTSAGSLIFN